MLTTKLPDRETMLAKLTAVADNSHLVQRLYPALMKLAGEELTGPGLAIAFTLAISDYSQGMPAQAGRAVELFIPLWIDALTDDEKVRSEARETLR